MNPLEFLEKALIDFAFRNYDGKATSNKPSSGVGDRYYLNDLTPQQLDIMRRYPRGIDSPGAREDMLNHSTRTGEQPPSWAERPRRNVF